MSKTVDATEVRQRVLKVIAAQFDTSPDAVESQDDAAFRDAYCVDSLDEIEIVMELENEFELMVEDDDAASWRTVNDVVNAITKLLREAA